VVETKHKKLKVKRKEPPASKHTDIIPISTPEGVTSEFQKITSKNNLIDIYLATHNKALRFTLERDISNLQ
jgi:hypothetical protein